MAKISIDLTSGTIEKEKSVIGIDLGTTNSLIASINPTDRSPYCLGTDDGSIVPSAIHFSASDILVGHEAIAKMVESPENSIYSVKRLMGKSYDDLEKHMSFFNYDIIDTGEEQLVKVKIDGKQFTPIELSSYVLKELKALAEKKLDQKVNKVVISVPAYFNDAQRQATRDAGKLAGLDVLRIINEPTAASLAYGIGLNQEEQKTVAVYDLGGGTFDVSILRIQNGIFEVLSTNGDTFLGGDDIDQAIVQHWINEKSINLNTSSDRQKLRLVAERVKKALSSEDSHEAQTELNGEKYIFTLNTAQLNSIAKPLIDKTIKCCKEALQDAEINSSEIDEVVLVGGSTRLRQVKKAVQEMFNTSTINDSLNPDEVVALGTAIEADILAGNRKDILLLDVTPLSLGIETLGGLMDVIIPRNSKIPNQVKRQYTTSIDGQVNMKVNVFQGERELVADNRSLGEFELKGIPAMPAGLPKIEVGFMLDADGILKVSATELRSGVHQEVALKPQYGLTDKEIEEMLLASLSNAEKDMEARSLIEAKTEAEQLIYGTEKFIKDNPDLLKEEHVNEIRGYLTKISQAIDAKNKDSIVQYSDELNAYTRSFAEKAMDKAIGSALKGKKV
ncbi:Fe-S protein assembly chaperone HscA [bacterium]|nr:Fe-S protein assembly chaperone HscA [bacterium]